MDFFAGEIAQIASRLHAVWCALAGSLIFLLCHGRHDGYMVMENDLLLSLWLTMFRACVGAHTVIAAV